MSQSGLRRFDYARDGHIRLAVGYVVAHRVVEENRLLRYFADLRPQRRETHLAHVDAVDEDAPAGHVEEARNQIHQGRLPCPAGPNQRDHFAAVDGQVDVVQHHRRSFTLAFLITEADVFQRDRIFESLERLRMFGLDDLILIVHEVEDGRRGSGSLLEIVVVDAEAADRIVHLEERDDEGEEDALFHSPVADFVAAHP